MVPFAAAGSAFDSDDDASFSAIVDEAVIIPAGAYDYHWGERLSFGVEFAVLSDGFSTGDTDTSLTGIFVNPRFEYGLNKNLSLTVDGNLGFYSADDVDLPFFSPTVGLRGYLPTGFGGFIISQQLGTVGVLLALPGSLAYDIPIPLGKTARLHIFPEVRWDPTFVFTGQGSGVIALFSAGGTLMFEF